MDKIDALQKENEELRKINLSLLESIEHLKARISHLETIIINFKRDKFGRKSEKVDLEDSLFENLFNEAEECHHSSVGQQEECEQKVSPYTRSKPGRKPIPDNLPREPKIHDIPDSEKICKCGCQLSKIGEDITEQLSYTPAHAVVIQHIRYKYACNNCKGDERDEAGNIIAIAPMEPQLLPHSILTPELFVYIIISKYVDHIPFYRLEKILSRSNIKLTRATFSNWVINVYERYKHLFVFTKELLLSGLLLGIDETSLQVHYELGRLDTQKSYMWVLRGGTAGRPILQYIYRKTRSADFLVDYLHDYKGVIQTDGFASYDAHFRNNVLIIHIACMAHIRRDFEKIWTANKIQLAGQILTYIRKLYAIEKEISNLELHKKERYADIVKIRMEKSKPIMDSLYTLLTENIQRYTPKSSMGKAISYALGQWSKMELYLSHGASYIDNNLVENAIRPFVIGRKNWLFAGCPQGAEASAFWYSLCETIRANNKEPFSTLLAFFKNLPRCQTQDDSKNFFLNAMAWT